MHNKERKELYDNVIRWFRENVPDAGTELDYDSPFHLLVAVILSAQCTDKRVNIVTPPLFRAYPEPADLAAASVEEIYAYIKSVSYPNNKARHLHDMAVMLTDEYDGVVPSDIDLLTRLPGVGTKTANVIASIIYDKPVIAVDTHVFRVSHRLGLSDGKTPLAVEKDLESHIAPEDRPVAHHWLILHGRYVCTARKPHCDACGLISWCTEHRISRPEKAGTDTKTKK